VSVTPADLTGTERAVILVLIAESRPVPNPDLIGLGPKLDKPGRDKLNRLGLIESHRSGGRFVHELSDRGWLDAVNAAHELYLAEGLGARDDAAAMQYLIPGWTFDRKRPALQRI
jgi:hypothetical protein